MTAAELLQRGRGIVTSWWFLPALAVAVCLYVVHGWGSEWRARTGAERRAEAAELRAQGFAAAKESSERQLKAEIAKSGALAAEMAKLQAAAPGSRPVAVATGTTGPRPAGGPARPDWPCTTPPATPPKSGGGAAAPPEQPASGVPAGAGCLLSAGDLGEVRVEAAALRTRAGNLVVVGVAEAWRLEPAPAARLFGGPLTLEVSAAAPKRAAGWGAGATAAVGRAGWVVGPAASPPPLSLWGMQLELLAGAGVGPTGEWVAIATGLVRW